MKAKFFGGPAHRKKFDVPDFLRIFKFASYDYRPVWSLTAPSSPVYNDVVGIKEHTYYRHDIMGQNQTFTIYIHEDSSIDEVLKKALT